MDRPFGAGFFVLKIPDIFLTIFANLVEKREKNDMISLVHFVEIAVF